MEDDGCYQSNREVNMYQNHRHDFAVRDNNCVRAVHGGHKANAISGMIPDLWEKVNFCAYIMVFFLWQVAYFTPLEPFLTLLYESWFTVSAPACNSLKDLE